MAKWNLHGSGHPRDSLGNNEAKTDYTMTDIRHRLSLLSVSPAADEKPAGRARLPPGGSGAHLPCCPLRNLTRLLTTRRQVR
ncbi:MAG TPA: hypothetical protein VGF29_00600, partial [Hyphomicrobiaceae bacterium]